MLERLLSRLLKRLRLLNRLLNGLLLDGLLSRLLLDGLLSRLLLDGLLSRGLLLLLQLLWQQRSRLADLVASLRRNLLLGALRRRLMLPPGLHRASLLDLLQCFGHLGRLRRRKIRGSIVQTACVSSIPATGR